jgi:hypothetical protein
MKPMRAKTNAKPKANPSKDYMKPVGGTKQKGYVAPGGSLFDVEADRKKNRYGGTVTKRTGRGVGEPNKGRYDKPGYTKTGINPTAMKATSGNPKPTTAQLAAGKKASATAKANAAAKAKAKAAADKAAKLKAATTAKKPTTGVYKRGNP